MRLTITLGCAALIASLVARGIAAGTGNFVLGTKNADECSSSASIGEQECLAAALAAIRSAGHTPDPNLVTGDWGHVPSGCSTDDSLDGQGDWTPHWNSRTGVRNGGGFTPVCKRQDCSVATASGKWKPLVYTNGGQEVSYTVGKTTTDSTERTKEWNAEVSATVSSSFKFFGSGVEASVTGSYSRSSAQTVLSAVEESTENALTYSFDKPGGQVWQFMYTIEDSCGVANIETRDLVVTTNRVETPCCLPGFALTQDKQYGPCAGGSQCTCSTSICNPPTRQTPAPTSRTPAPAHSTPAPTLSTPAPTLLNKLSTAEGVQSTEVFTPAGCSVMGSSLPAGVGSTQACVCSNGNSGAQSCGESGVWSACSCISETSAAAKLLPQGIFELFAVLLAAISFI